MLSLNFDICLLHMLKIFKFEFVAWLDLNSKEKRKEKKKRLEIWKKKENPKQPATPLIQLFGPLGPAHHVPALPALAARWDWPIGAISLSCALVPRSLPHAPQSSAAPRAVAVTPAPPVCPVFPSPQPLHTHAERAGPRRTPQPP
jgi:hypothetical protein